MSKKKTTGEKIKTKMSTPRIQKLLSYWLDTPDEWISNIELNKEFVEKYKHIIEQPSGMFYDSKKKKTYNQKPKPAYSHTSSLSRDLTDLVDLGILEKRKKTRSKGKPNTEYKPSKRYKLHLFRLGLKESLDSFSNEKIFLYDIPPVKTSRKNMLGGFPKEFFKELTKSENDFFNDCILNINEYLRRLELLRQGKRIEIFNNLVEDLKKSMKNKKVKNLSMKENYYIWMLIYTHLLIRYEEGDNISSMSKNDFFNIFYLPSDKKEEIVETKKANKEWSEYFFKSQWNKKFFLRSKIHFSFEDIFLIVEWAFQNRNKFAMFMPMNIMFSRYYTPYSIEELFESH